MVLSFLKKLIVLKCVNDSVQYWITVDINGFYGVIVGADGQRMTTTGNSGFYLVILPMLISGFKYVIMGNGV